MNTLQTNICEAVEYIMQAKHQFIQMQDWQRLIIATAVYDKNGDSLDKPYEMKRTLACSFGALAHYALHGEPQEETYDNDQEHEVIQERWHSQGGSRTLQRKLGISLRDDLNCLLFACGAPAYPFTTDRWEHGWNYVLHRLPRVIHHPWEEGRKLWRIAAGIQHPYRVSVRLTKQYYARLDEARAPIYRLLTDPDRIFPKSGLEDE